MINGLILSVLGLVVNHDSFKSLLDKVEFVSLETMQREGLLVLLEADLAQEVHYWWVLQDYTANSAIGLLENAELDLVGVS